MVNEEDEIQIKELLKRADIKTMKKDLQKLREGEALKEKDKIMKMKTEEELKREKEKLEKERAEREKVEEGKKKIMEKLGGGRKETIEELKKRATEPEKQKVFYLETEKQKLETDLKNLQKEQEPPLLLEKNNLLRKKGDVEKKLNKILGGEKKFENELNFLDEKEKQTQNPKEKQKLEKRRWEVEEERKKIEVKRWAEEKELETLGNQIQGVEGNYQKVLEEEEDLKQKIKETEASLESVYLIISQRLEEEKAMEEEKTKLEALKAAEEESKKKEEIRRKEWTRKGTTGFLKKMSDLARKGISEKIEKTSEKEEGERKKFLKKVEEWAEKEKK